jgi:phosphotransferase system IIA component
MKSKEKSTWVMKLPIGAKILVEVGEKVETGQKLAEFISHLVETFDYSGSLSDLSEQKREELNNFFKDKMVQQGEAFHSVGIFKNKICFPLSGVCLGFDEFKNLRIEKTEDETREIFSPVDGEVLSLEEGKMTLGFEAKEYEGEGLNELKAWGEGKVEIVDEAKFLDYEMEDRVLFTENLDRSFLLKAQVVGIRSVVIKGNEEIKELDIDVPVLRLSDEIWNEFMKENKGKEKKMLVNAKMNKLLLVLE